MTYCKICDGGHKNIYEAEKGAPLKCSVCGRNIVRVTEKLYIPENENADKKSDDKDKAEIATDSVTFEMCLQSPDGIFVIPIRGETIVGRNSAGKEYLENFCDVSREHFVITPRPSGIAATIRDCSSYGTHINGIKMEKDSGMIVTSGTTVRLATDAILKFIVKEVE